MITSTTSHGRASRPFVRCQKYQTLRPRLTVHAASASTIPSSLPLSTSSKMSSQQSVYVRCLDDQVPAQSLLSKLTCLRPTGPKSDRSAPDSRGRLTVKWEEFSTGKHSRQRFVSRIHVVCETRLMGTIQPAQRNRHSHTTTSHSSTY